MGGFLNSGVVQSKIQICSDANTMSNQGKKSQPEKPGSGSSALIYALIDLKTKVNFA